jgi:hypothetical protein
MLVGGVGEEAQLARALRLVRHTAAPSCPARTGWYRAWLLSRVLLLAVVGVAVHVGHAVAGRHAAIAAPPCSAPALSNAVLVLRVLLRNETALPYSVHPTSWLLVLADKPLRTLLVLVIPMFR